MADTFTFLALILLLLHCTEIQSARKQHIYISIRKHFEYHPG